MHAPLDRHLPNERHIPVATLMKVSCSYRCLTDDLNIQHYSDFIYLDATRHLSITPWPTKATVHPVEKVGPCGNQLVADARAQCYQQLRTDQAAAIAPTMCCARGYWNGWRHSACKCTWQQQ